MSIGLTLNVHERKTIAAPKPQETPQRVTKASSTEETEESNESDETETSTCEERHMFGLREVTSSSSEEGWNEAHRTGGERALLLLNSEEKTYERLVLDYRGSKSKDENIGKENEKKTKWVARSEAFLLVKGINWISNREISLSNLSIHKDMVIPTIEFSIFHPEVKPSVARKEERRKLPVQIEKDEDDSFEKEMILLYTMGFKDPRCLSLLQEYDGNVQAVVNRLLG
eukprot:TRINITY_DN706_c0_g1_i2.p1 TRINITY_DN706_c0_g1~~TRINITY_DN706_c0_g1_i2.p1  ORF type:complete len:228 (-),score=53.67 TRINITY_DN706_c0_g1_i2:186-869(-)